MSVRTSKHVLFVDDEPTSRHIAERILRTGLPAVRVTCAADGAEALKVLDREPVDLLITDMAMPVLDGIELLLAVAHRRLVIPLLVVTGHKSSVSETLALSNGAIEYFAKPLRADAFLSCVHRLLFSEVHRGQLEVISLAGIVRMIATERKTCSLRVTAATEQGVLFFADGDLVDARQGLLRGLPAARRILGWPDATLTLDLDTAAPVCTPAIHISAADLHHLVANPSAPVASPAGAVVEAAAAIEPPPEFCPSAGLPALERIDLGSPVWREPTQPYRSSPQAPPHAAAQPAAPVLPYPPTLASRAAAVVRHDRPPPPPAPPRVAAPVRTLPISAIVRRASAAERVPDRAASPEAASPAGPAAASERPPEVSSVVSPAAFGSPDVSLARPPDGTATPATSATDSSESAAPPDPALVRVVEAEDYHDLMDRARDLLRVAEFRAAELILLRALEHRPGDRVVQQNLKVLARRRGSLEEFVRPRTGR